jgi:hypothetical protein
MQITEEKLHNSSTFSFLAREAVSHALICAAQSL